MIKMEIYDSYTSVNGMIINHKEGSRAQEAARWAMERITVPMNVRIIIDEGDDLGHFSITVDNITSDNLKEFEEKLEFIEHNEDVVKYIEISINLPEEILHEVVITADTVTLCGIPMKDGNISNVAETAIRILGRTRNVLSEVHIKRRGREYHDRSLYPDLSFQQENIVGVILKFKNFKLAALEDAIKGHNDLNERGQIILTYIPRGWKYGGVVGIVVDGIHTNIKLNEDVSNTFYSILGDTNYAMVIQLDDVSLEGHNLVVTSVSRFIRK